MTRQDRRLADRQTAGTPRHPNPQRLESPCPTGSAFSAFVQPWQPWGRLLQNLELWAPSGAGPLEWQQTGAQETGRIHMHPSQSSCSWGRAFNHHISSCRPTLELGLELKHPTEGPLTRSHPTRPVLMSVESQGGGRLVASSIHSDHRAPAGGAPTGDQQGGRQALMLGRGPRGSGLAGCRAIQAGAGSPGHALLRRACSRMTHVSRRASCHQLPDVRLKRRLDLRVRIKGTRLVWGKLHGRCLANAGQARARLEPCCCMHGHGGHAE